MQLFKSFLNGCALLLFVLFTGCAMDDAETDRREIIRSDQAPEAVGPYSQAVRAGNTLFLAGQIGLDPETGQLAGDDLETQTRQALQNIRGVLEEAGFTLGDVADVQVYLTDMDNYRAFNELYAQWFPQNPPARAVVEVSRLPLDAKVEIKAVAVGESK